MTPWRFSPDLEGYHQSVPYTNSVFHPVLPPPAFACWVGHFGPVNPDNPRRPSWEGPFEPEADVTMGC